MSNNQITHEQFAELAVTAAQTSKSWPGFFATFARLAAPYMNQFCADPKCQNPAPLSETYRMLVSAAKLAQDLGIGPKVYAEELTAKIDDEDDVPDAVMIIIIPQGRDDDLPE